MEIPAWPAARPLELADKPLFDSLFATLQPRVSELTFAGLYLFRAAHGYRVSRLAGATVVLGRGYDYGEYCLPPLGEDADEAARTLLAGGMTIYGADDALAQRLATGGFSCQPDRNAFDYLYLRDELAALPGSRYHKKRNRIAYFTARHAYETGPFTPDHRERCRQLLASWRQVAGREGNRSLALEVAAADEGLGLATELGLEGVVVTVGAAVKAFALGERLNNDTAVCHFEKTDPFLEGAAQLVNREFARLLFTGCTYLNREQDLGEPGLRAAKLSYHPVELVQKYRIGPAQK